MMTNENLNNSSNAVVKEYDGYDITFLTGSNVMVNATEMAKPFEKRPVDWLQNQQTQEFLASLSEVRKSTSADLVKVTKGGDPKMQGTWMHEDVALEFARWLSPKFAIWCNDRIKELFMYGKTSISSDNSYDSHDMKNKLSAEEARQILDIATDTIKKLNEIVPQSSPAKIAMFKELVEPYGIKVPNTATAKNLDLGENLLDHFKINMTPTDFFDMLYNKGWSSKPVKRYPISTDCPVYSCQLKGEGVEYGVNYWDRENRCYWALFHESRFKSLCLDLLIDLKNNAS